MSFRMAPSRTATFVAALTALCAGPVHAQPDPATTESVAADESSYGNLFEQYFRGAQELFDQGRFAEAALAWWGVTQVHTDMVFAERERFAQSAIRAWLRAHTEDPGAGYLDAADHAWLAHTARTGSRQSPSAMMAALRWEIDRLAGSGRPEPAPATIPPPPVTVEPANSNVPEPAPAVEPEELDPNSPEIQATLLDEGDPRRRRGAVLSLTGAAAMIGGSILAVVGPARVRDVEARIAASHIQEPRPWTLSAGEMKTLDDANRRSRITSAVGLSVAAVGLGGFVWGIVDLATVSSRSPSALAASRTRLTPELSAERMGLVWSGRF